MIDRIIEFSARNKFIVIFFTIAAIVGAVYAIKNIPLDAIPDLSDTQVIIYSQWDRSPDIIEDQVTYPIVTAMLGAPGVKAIRGFSDFGFSYVYVIFQDGTDIYWARSRTRGVSQQDHRPAPAGRSDGDRAGCHGVGLGLSVCSGGQVRQQQPGGPAELPGLVPALLAPKRAGRCRGGHRRRLSETVPGERESQCPAGLQHPADEGRGGGPAEQQRRRRQAARNVRHGVHDPGQGLCQVAAGPGEHRHRHG